MTNTYHLKDGTLYTVRRANVNDHEELIKVLLKIAEEDEHTLLSFSEAEKQILASQERLKNLLQAQDQHFIYLVGLVNNQIIGFCDIHLGKNERDKHTAEFGRSILKEWRRTGAGKYLQQSAIEFVKDLKFIKKINLNITSLNANSIMSCQSNGFTLESCRKMELLLPNGTYADMLNFVFYLDS